MTQIQALGINMSTASLIACNHCGIVALDTPAFGWRRFYDDDGELTHHCPVAVQYQDAIRGYLVHGFTPDEAIVYEDPERWQAEVLGPQDKAEAANALVEAGTIEATNDD